jgi:hypothetical protein
VCEHACVGVWNNDMKNMVTSCTRDSSISDYQSKPHLLSPMSRNTYSRGSGDITALLTLGKIGKTPDRIVNA